MPIPKLLSLCVFAGLMATVSACSSYVRSFTTTEVVVTPPNHVSMSQTMSLLPSSTGVYPPGSGEHCCWLGKRAMLRANLVRPASTLTMTILVPRFMQLRRNLSLIVVTKGRRTTFHNLGLGINALVIPLHVRSHGPITLELTPNFWFVPKDEHISRDTRTLSLVFVSLKAG